ncbi:MAG: helix-turn-helix transcriptional regulator [Peptostreptococcaceae bacterium]|nr:helix-turn-helix transcriptional regulator [Peptostreptococcaceae bacterium]
MDTFGKRFKEARKEKRLTQEQLADKFHLKKSSISRYENDKQMPEVNLLKEFADFFGVTVDYLLGSESIKTEDLNTKNSSNILFENAQDAMAFILKQPSIMAFGVPDLTDEEIIEFANDILSHIKLVSYKYKK